MTGIATCRQMQEGEQAAASAAGGQQQVGWRADDEWMDEYRAADSRGSRDVNAPSARPGMAPEEEALIQVSSNVHVNATSTPTGFCMSYGLSLSAESLEVNKNAAVSVMTGMSNATIERTVPAAACTILY